MKYSTNKPESRKKNARRSQPSHVSQCRDLFVFSHRRVSHTYHHTYRHTHSHILLRLSGKKSALITSWERKLLSGYVRTHTRIPRACIIHDTHRPSRHCLSRASSSHSALKYSSHSVSLYVFICTHTCTRVLVYILYSFAHDFLERECVNSRACDRIGPPCARV